MSLMSLFRQRLARGASFVALGLAAASFSLAAQADVAVYGAELATWNDDVVSKITAASGGSLGAVVSHVLCNGDDPCEPTPTLAQLQAYSAVLVYSDLDYADPVALGDVLADYVDAGGTVVMAFSSFYNGDFAIQGRLVSGGYLPLTTGGANLHGSPQSLVPVVTGHPLLQGVGGFNGGISFRNAVSLTAGATLVANWSDAASTPLIAVKGNVVALNFFPPSFDARDDLWDVGTDGGRIMANALAWSLLISPNNLSAGQQGTAYTPVTFSVAGGGVAPFTWSATGLPAGMSLSPAGELSGTPTAYGTFTVQVSVQDSSATPLRRTMPIPLLVNPAPVAAPTPVPTLGEWALGLLALLLAALGVRASALRRA